MKNLLKCAISHTIGMLANLIVLKYRPTIVMVTGSVGKTTTKDAIKAALSPLSFVRASEKSYNSEFGVPLTVIGAGNPWSDLHRWLVVYKEAFALLFLPNHYPKILVLEVGADRPGDLAKILRIATPHIVVVTRLPEVPVHVEAYPTPEAVREEEFVPAYGLAPAAPLIVCSEDRYALSYAKRLPATVTTFGFGDTADFRITDSKVHLEEGIVSGMEANLVFCEKPHAFTVTGALGRQQLLANAAAIAAGHALGFSLKELIKNLEELRVPPGRMHLLKGIHGSLLIDDSYNSSPIAAEEALASLALVPHAKRKIAVLGDMLELGRYSVAEHERIGTLVAQSADMLVTVGVRARKIADGARAGGLDESVVHSFTTAEEAVDFLKPLVRDGDVILMKGSQNKIRLERVTEALLLDPEDRNNLVRQEKEWRIR